ncbi:UbiA prenyltransferase family-domain-containing protein [Chiua virens]|nr:UbiA prenyltransferase family-domain-containing protein [Chiua virens]
MLYLPYERCTPTGGPLILHTIFTLLFLFTKADIRTALIPQTVFALAVASVCHLSRILHVIAWIWLHLLTCNIANQIKAPDEDKINKPFRPLPSGRISEHHARILRWTLVLVCLAVSLTYSVELLLTSLKLQILTVLYSELHGDECFLLKNALTAVMYGCAGFGGALLAGCDRSHVPKTAQLAVQLSTAVFASTLHAQDFKDVLGDRLTALCIPLWSICLSCVWRLDTLSAMVFVAYSGYTGIRFLIYQSVEDDKRSCRYYSFWLSIHHILPAYSRICMAAVTLWSLMSHDFVQVISNISAFITDFEICIAATLYRRISR